MPNGMYPRERGDNGLTKREQTLVDLLVSGLDLDRASTQAGYASTWSARTWISGPKGAAALHSEMSRRLTSGAGVAFNLLEGVIRGTIPAPAAARVRAALAWLDRAGFTAAKPQESQQVGRPKALSEMTVEELRTAVAGLRQIARGQAPDPDATLEDMLQ